MYKKARVILCRFLILEGIVKNIKKIFRQGNYVYDEETLKNLHIDNQNEFIWLAWEKIMGL